MSAQAEAPKVVMDKCPECGAGLVIDAAWRWHNVVVLEDGWDDFGELEEQYTALICERGHFLERRDSGAAVGVGQHTEEDSR